MLHAAGAVLDNPDGAATVIGDGEGETGHWWLVGDQYLLEPSQPMVAVLPIFSTSTVERSQPNNLRTQNRLKNWPLLWRSWMETFCRRNGYSDDHEAAHALFAEKLDGGEEIKKVQADSQRFCRRNNSTQYTLSWLLVFLSWTWPKAGRTPIEGVPCAPSANPSGCCYMEHVECRFFHGWVISSSYKIVRRNW